MLPVPLESSLLASVLYDPTRRLLELDFHSGQRYRYFDVPNACYRQLLDADSKGTYFNSHIRNHFPFQRLSPPASPIVLARRKTK
jgi:hypothetical protein